MPIKHPVILIVQETIPHYRIDLFKELYAHCPGVKVIHSSNITKDGLVETLDLPFPNLVVPQHRLGRLRWQSLVFLFLKERPEYLVLGLEFKHLANWFLWLIAPMFGTRVVWWTHGYNIHLLNKGLRYRLDRAVKTFVMKHSYRVLLYTEYCMSELVANGIPGNRIIILNNALNEVPIQEAFAAVSPEELVRINEASRESSHTIAFIGRLTREKKPELVLSLAQKLKRTLPDLRVFIIGDGSEKVFLEQKSKVFGLEDAVFFTGTINDPAKLAPFMMLTDFIVLPGAVGLSIVHSFIYGIPFLTLKDEAHSPEVTYLKSRYNGYLADDIDDMTRWLEKTFDDEISREALRKNCRSTIKDNVNLSSMVTNFRRAFEG